ncbi:MAG: hypothetical protein JST00_41015 [Deltaproteobacteria bacterium]|nr:hypothetical protein [Deltaproteobacteria bacterium]
MRGACFVFAAALVGCSGSDTAFTAEDAGDDGSLVDGTADGAPADGAPSDGTPADGTPADGTSADGTTDGAVDGSTDAPPDTLVLPDGGCGGTLCGSKCTDTTTDPANCGACGKACTGGTPACIGGTCACPPSSTCGGRCVDLTSDIDNCGACGTTCKAGELCVGSKCVCNAGLTACGGACVDTKADGANCGGCGVACKTGEVCKAGACAPVAGGCGTGLTLCTPPGGGAGACVDLKRSNSHCGSCTKVCSADKACINGECRDAVPAPFCKTCPCPTCTGDVATCCGSLVPGGNAFCIESASCPVP